MRLERILGLGTAMVGLAALVGGTSLSAQQAAEPAHARPNIIAVLMDDVDFASDCTMGEAVSTPVLDRLAANDLTDKGGSRNASCNTR